MFLIFRIDSEHNTTVNTYVNTKLYKITHTADLGAAGNKYQKTKDALQKVYSRTKYACISNGRLNSRQAVKQTIGLRSISSHRLVPSTAWSDLKFKMFVTPPHEDLKGWFV